MKVGDLVEVIETMGRRASPTSFKRHGLGVVLQLIEGANVPFGAVGRVDLGREVVVSLQSTGKTRKFCEEDVSVVDASVLNASW